MVSQEKTPLERLRGVLTDSEGTLQVKATGPFQAVLLCDIIDDPQCTYMYVQRKFVDAAVRPAVPESFGNIY